MKRCLLMALFFLVGCAPWVEVGGLYRDEVHKFSVELPQGWLKLNQTDYIFITRDGGLLQKITLERIYVDTQSAYTKKKFNKDLLANEAAEIMLDNVDSHPRVLNLKVLENRPVNINELSGFKIVFVFNNKYNEVKYKGTIYGFIVEEWIYLINYEAPLRYYFDRDIKIFEKVIETFRLNN